jgi:GTPase SAR1 family protein
VHESFAATHTLPGTGKTSVIRRFVMGKYVEGSDDQDIAQQMPSKRVTYGDCSMILNFFDTAKQEKYVTHSVHSSDL